MEQHIQEPKTRLGTTLGDLIIALTEEATPYTRNDREAYAFVAVALAHVLRQDC